jgi:hypothetical protein
VKSLLSNLIGLWNLQENTSYPSSSTSSSSSHSSLSLPLFTPTVRLGEILRRSQILIPPLCHSVEFLDGKTTLTPSEITNVLMSFWIFIRDHPPTTQEYVVTTTATSAPASLASSVSFLRQVYQHSPALSPFPSYSFLSSFLPPCIQYSMSSLFHPLFSSLLSTDPELRRSRLFVFSETSPASQYFHPGPLLLSTLSMKTNPSKCVSVSIAVENHRKLLHYPTTTTDE